MDVTSPGRNDVDVASCGCKSCFVDVMTGGRNVAWMQRYDPIIYYEKYNCNVCNINVNK